MGDLPRSLLHAGFFTNALRSPDSCALVVGDHSSSYRSLAGLAGGMRRALEGAGLRPGDTVAVILEPGRAHAGAALGVLAAGGVYSPLDLTTPQERRRLELDRLGARLAVVDDVEVARFVRTLGVTVLAGMLFGGLRSLVRALGEASLHRAPTGSNEAPAAASVQRLLRGF